MSVMFFLLLLLGLVLALGAFVVVGSVLSPAARDHRAEVREAKGEALAAKTREKIATRALRAIANGAGAPVLEAQDALDAIESTYTKELNS